MGALLKFLLLFLGGIYLLRLISPFLFKLMLSSFVKKTSNQKQKKETPPPNKTKPPSDTIGEYIDYEELD
ncbi:hypothetical protein N9H57_00810 [Flavobacteriaceae bacterium]|nr:hypothetical protein [Flavobacteriaceae bacterium]MDA8947660.1 hypothetical protein [Flavobacteriaceae bacterium]MDA9015896.1 hypothetical protein [Flavobacteriaceae bacterium]MDB3861979.1 hypothetical protein [Flavobacteriaceae bacterium]MDC3354881.1 hypothetical protein [Flavobacteriaceae bacterium]